jgi:hypothetical protein
MYACTAVLAALLASPPPASAQQSLYDPPTGERFVIEGAAGFWRPAAEMSVASEQFGIVGTLIDFKRDLGLSDQMFRELHATLKAGRKHKFRFQFIPLDYEQSARIQRDIVFNGQRYRIGLDVESEFNWNAYRFGYEYDFLVKDWGFAGFIAEAKYTDVRAELRTSTIREWAQVSAPVPAVGGIVRYYFIPNVSITGEFSGITIPEISQSYDGHYFDLDIYGTVNFNRYIGGQFGYRSFDVGLLLDDDRGSFVVKGVYFGVVARY